MPTETFFRLPEEKRERIINAAWKELTSVSFPQVSINRIVREAEIARGSFYQYFSDKDELLRFLAGGVRDYVVEGYLAVLRDSQGDMFRAALSAYDQLAEMQTRGGGEIIDRSLCFLRQNPGLDVQKLVSDGSGEDHLEPIWEILDSGILKRRGRRYMRTGFHLCILVLGNAALDSLAHPERWEENRLWLADAIQIIQYGCAAPAGGTSLGGTEQ